MSGETIYTPGNSVHFIQARKALEDVGQWSATSLSRISDGYVELLDEHSKFIIPTHNSIKYKWQPATHSQKNGKLILVFLAHFKM